MMSARPLRISGIAAAALGLAACQPQLNSALPPGPAAYDAIAVDMDQLAANNAHLRPGDQIAINVFQEEDLSLDKLVIDQSGMINVPLLGGVQASGRSAAQLATELEVLYGRRFLRNPSVSVILLESTSRFVSVEGQVEDPGVYPVQDGFTLLSAISMAGSPSDNARLDEVLIFREVNGERMGGRFNLTDIRAGRVPDPRILPGDVVVVGFSRVRGAYEDFLRIGPGLLNAFVRY